MNIFKIDLFDLMSFFLYYIKANMKTLIVIVYFWTLEVVAEDILVYR